MALVLCLPVRLTVLAPGELVPARPAVIRAPLEGVIDTFHVQPNQSVKAGQVLFEFDKAPLEARYDVASQSLATAQAEYRQSAQLALSDAKSKAQMALVQGKIDERKADEIEAAVNAVLDEGCRTADMMAPGCTRVGCTEMGNKILEHI